jgi:hypothetical protein
MGRHATSNLSGCPAPRRLALDEAPVAAGGFPMTTFDVFLSHNSKDKDLVERLAEKLKRAGIEPWLDKWLKGFFIWIRVSRRLGGTRG